MLLISMAMEILGKLKDPMLKGKPNICNFCVISSLSVPYSASTAAECRPKPRVTEYETKAAAMILRASEKNMKKSSHPMLLIFCDRANNLRKTVTIAIPVNTQAKMLISF